MEKNVMKTKTAVQYEAGAPLVVEQADLEGPAPGEVLVRLAACGVCHSDLHILRGEWAGFDPPIVVGHEGSGMVESVGEGVTELSAGDPVVLGWKTHCGVCRQCTNGWPHLCDQSPQVAKSSTLTVRGQPVHRMLATAFLSQYAVVPQSAVIPIRAEMPLPQAALLGCAVMTGVGAAMNTARVRPGTTVAVYGCGGVGVNVIQGAALCGAARIIGVDLADAKLDYARPFGLTDAINASQQDPVQALLELTGGTGADYAFEAVGSARVMQQVFASLAKRGVAVYVGMPAYREKTQVALPVVPFFGERWVTGSYYGSANLQRDIPRLVDLYLGGKLDLDALVARRYTLEEVNAAFDDLAQGKPGRGIITF
jgi:S-(hydroxymethyl)glutathione dehydrogenase/alcohol dehydrogenase